MQTGQPNSADPSVLTNQFNAMNFLIQQLMGKANHVAVCKVTNCTNSGGVAEIGTVTLQPMLYLLDGTGKTFNPATLYNIPYFRIQGGTNAIILDPKVGDIGICIFADQDISTVKKTKKQSPPNSARRNSLSDGIFLGALWGGGSPVNYIQFHGNDINIVSTGNVNVTGTAINLQNAGTALNTLLNSTLLTWLNAHTHSTTTIGAPTGVPLTTPPSTVSTTVTKAE